MKHPLSIFGILGFLLVLALFVVDGMLQPAAGEPASEPGPPAFPVPMVGLAMAETAVAGPVVFVSYHVHETAEGHKLRRPNVRVEGIDPQPEGGGWVRLNNVVIVFYKRDGDGEAFRIECPRARVALNDDPRRLAIDESRPWELEQPRLVSTTLLEGKELRLKAEVAEIHPETREFRSTGPFQAWTEGFEISGHDLRNDPESGAILFGGPGEKGAVEWKLTAPDGAEYHGASDGGGSLRSGPGESRILSLAAVRESSMVFPETTLFPGTVRSRGMRLVIEPVGGGWQPIRAEGLEHSSWDGPNGWLRGGPWTGVWRPDGEFEGFSVTGPLRGMLVDKDVAWITARGGAWISPLAGADLRGFSSTGSSPPVLVYLHGGAYLDNFQGRVRAEWILYDPRVRLARRPEAYTSTGISAGGGVYLDTPFGAAYCNRLEDLGREGWRLEGSVILHPADGFGNAAGAPLVHIHQEGRLRMEGGFSLAGWSPTGPWSLTGLSLESSRRHDLLRTRARGEVVWRTQGTVFRGEEMLAVSAEIQSIELLGEPAVGLLDGPQGLFRVIARRMVLQEGTLLLSGRPELTLPAAALGIEGDEVTVKAPRMRREADGAWTLSGGVTFEGGLEGKALRVDWAPEQEMVLSSGATPVTLSGKRPGIGTFHLSAEILRMDPAGVVRLERGAVAELRGATWGLQELTDAAEEIRIQAWTAEIGPGGGWFEGGANLEGGDLTGQAERIEWVAQNGSLVRISLEGKAELDSPRVVGRADDIHYRPEGSQLRLDGTSEKPATLELPDGRFLTGEWLELDLEEMLLSGGPGSTRR